MTTLVTVSYTTNKCPFTKINTTVFGIDDYYTSYCHFLTTSVTIIILVIFFNLNY